MKQGKKGIALTLWNAFCGIVVCGFIVFTMLIGGSAGLGFEENGQYFVGNHGKLVEVTQTLWRISSIWEILFWVFILLAPIGIFVIEHIRGKR